MGKGMIVSNIPIRQHHLRRGSRWVVTSVLLVFVLILTSSLALLSAAMSCPHQKHNGHIFTGLTELRDALVWGVFGRAPGSRPRLSSAGLTPSALSSYRDYLVVRFNVTTAQETHALQQVTQSMLLDVWSSTPSYVDVRVRKDNFEGVIDSLPSSLASSCSVVVPDIEALVASTYPVSPGNPPTFDDIPLDETSDHSTPLSDIDNLFFQDYQPLSVIFQWMRLLETMFPDIVDIVHIGNSYEGREINALRVRARPEDGDTGDARKAIIVTGGVHAREWISTSSTNYAAWSFITGYLKDPVITKMLQTFDLIFIPALNPDGIDYSWETDRLWRKTRQTTRMRWCSGLDLDRVFGFQWNARSDPCAETYGGSEPFEATEAFQFAEWVRMEMLDNNVKFVGLLDLHSYSQQVLFPFSYSCTTNPPNLENLEELGAGLVKAIRLTSGEAYTLGAACEGAGIEYNPPGKQEQRLMVATGGGGSLMDWVFHDLGVRFSYQIRLRDTGNYGFLLPKEYIIPTGEEVVSAMRYFGDFLMGNNGIERNEDEIKILR